MCGSGERRVNVAVEVMRWKVASSIKCGAASSGSAGSSSGWLGFFGGFSFGVGISMGSDERASPRLGCEGMVALFVRRVMVVL